MNKEREDYQRLMRELQFGKADIAVRRKNLDAFLDYLRKNGRNAQHLRTVSSTSTPESINRAVAKCFNGFG